jgi:hypothetical protein
MTLSADTADRVVCASSNPQEADSPPAPGVFLTAIPRVCMVHILNEKIEEKNT